MKVLFALNQTNDTIIEEKFLNLYKSLTNSDFEIRKEYDLDGVYNKLKFDNFNLVIINEELERDNSVTPTFIDNITDKYPNTRIIILVAAEHRNDIFIKRLFNLGVYDLLYPNDVTIEGIVNLIINPRTKAEAKIYLGLHDISDVSVESELSYIPEVELNNILSHFMVIDKAEYSHTFDHIYKQYNEKQLIHLVKSLPDSIIDVLIEAGNENYLKHKIDDKASKVIEGDVQREDNNNIDEIQIDDSIELKRANKFKLPERASTKERIITKIEKEYINVVPDDYKKIVALIGERKSGVTTIVSLLANYYAIDKKVLVIDASENGLFRIKSWGNENIVNSGGCQELRINERLVVIKPNDNNDILDLIETYKYQNDVILIDADFNLPSNILKWIDMILHIATLDIRDVKTCKDYLKKAMLVGVNIEKVHLVINKDVKCKVNSKDIMALYKDPIPFLEEEHDGLPIGGKLITIPFSFEFYKNSLSNYIYIDEDLKVTDDIYKAIKELSNLVYPLRSKKKGIGLINRLGLKVF